MNRYLVILLIVSSCNQVNDCVLVNSINGYEFNEVKFEPVNKYDVNFDSLFLFIENMYPYFDRNDVTQEQLNSLSFLRNTKQIPESIPMDLSYFALNNEFCDSDKILRLALFCHNIMTNGDDFEINTSESEILAMPLDTVVSLFNCNELIGQCGEYDAFAQKLYEKHGFETITVNPKLYNGSDPLGHIYTIVYSPYSKKYYPIDIQNNCYWILNNGSLADFNSILNGFEYSRRPIDTINGRKDIIISDFIVPFEYQGKFLGTGEYKSITTSSKGIIYRTIIEPSENIRPNNYIDRTSKILNKDSPSWEDFIFKAGIFNESEKINKRLFYGENQRLNNFWESIK